MNKGFLKAGMLIFLLVIPALFFIFLKSCGANNFELPTYFPELDERGHIQVIEGDTLFHAIEDFTLEDQLEETMTFSDYQKDIKVVSFFFSRCGTICPVINQNLSRVQDTFKEDEHVRFLSITVDPEHDSSSVLNAYSKDFVQGKSTWQFLTGDKLYIYNLAIKQFKLPVMDASSDNEAEVIDDIDMAFIHSDKVVLVDNNNLVRGIYDGTDLEEIERLKLEIKVLKDIINKQK